MRYLERTWQSITPLSLLLMPVSAFFCAIVQARRLAYRRDVLRRETLPATVVVVGNISVGGTGKTPLVIALAQALRAAGRRPGVITRGYRGRSPVWPVRVGPDTDPCEVGDEAVLLARRSGVPVVAGPDRVASVRLLIEHDDCDVVLSDDGLQHYRLRRDVEIVVVDGQRGLGNRACLPAGPLREPVSRLREADFVLINGSAAADAGFELVPGRFVNLVDPARSVGVDHFLGREVAAVAGIGNTLRFFRQLASAGIRVIPHAFPDHYAFPPTSLRFLAADTVIMTEKDAVKCARFAAPDWWYQEIEARVPPALLRRIVDKVQEKRRG